jgi:site-specific recombinase XerD
METQRIELTDDLRQTDVAMESFLLDRKAGRRSSSTIQSYRYGLGTFIKWLKPRGISSVEQIASADIRLYLLHLEEKGAKAITAHSHARSIRAWCNWMVKEGLLVRSPMGNVTMPRFRVEAQDAYTEEDVERMLDVCDRRTALGTRDYAIILALLDTGLRASELVSLNVGDVDMKTGLVPAIGKGQKRRVVRLGFRTRGKLIQMMVYRSSPQPEDPLWMAYDRHGNELGRLSFWGLNSLIKRIGSMSGVKPCHCHRFRKTFALWCVRNGMDTFTLRLLLGHSDVLVTQRYVALTEADIQRKHEDFSPMDWHYKVQCDNNRGRGRKSR